jgi:hypothetical protein
MGREFGINVIPGTLECARGRAVAGGQDVLKARIGGPRTSPEIVTWVRLIRQGDVVEYAITSQEGVRSTICLHTVPDLGPALKVGVIAGHTGTATFEDFIVEPLDGAKK